MDQVDIVIVGAGVVGLSVAARLANASPDYQIIVFEKNKQFGQETSSRNSEVIHSGIYYPRDSLKTELCVKGNDLLYQFCDDYGVSYQRLGKLIIAIEDKDHASLQDLAEKATANRINGVEMLNADKVKQLEPAIASRGALLVPSTGIIDSHALMRCFVDIAVRKGTMVAYCHEVIGVEPYGANYKIDFRNPDGSSDSIVCSWLINCAGLYSDRIAEMVGIDADKEGYRIYPCKGEYFSISFNKSKLVKRLIYPPPLKELQGLGIHLTKNLDGRLRLGPNAFYVGNLDYSVNLDHLAEFYTAAKDFLPFLESSDLEPEMAGVRPKLQGPEQSFRDFLIRHEIDRGLKGVINLVGIESPGLTCCLSIADLVTKIILENS